MVVIKKAVSFDPEVWADLVRVAEAERIGVSTLVNRALRHELRIQRGLAAVGEWEAEMGAFTKEELDEADRTLGRIGGNNETENKVNTRR
jgi:predicted transcriptional regulator